MKNVQAIAAVLVGLSLLTASPALAVDYNTAASGNWSTVGNWSPEASSGGPGADDSVSLNVAITNDADASGFINNVTINNLGSLILDAKGLTAGGSVNVWNGGTLNLGDQTLAVTGSVQFGGNGGPGVLTRGTGSMAIAGGINVAEGSNIALGAGDSSVSLNVSGVYWNGSENVYSAASTAATSNVTDVVTVYSSPLTLGADMALSQYIQVGGGSWNTTDHQGALIMNGHSVTCGNIQFQGNGSGKIVRTLATETLNAAGGSITVGEGSHLDLIAGDTCAYLSVSGADVDETGTPRWSAASTSATSNVTDVVTVYSAPLTLGADMVLSQYIQVGGGNWNTTEHLGALIMNGHSVTAPSIQFLGNGSGKIVRTLPTETLNAAGGSISIGEGSHIDLIAGDTCAYLSLSGADVDETGTPRWSAASTSATSNVTDVVTVYSAPLTLGADMVLSQYIQVGGGNWNTTEHQGALIMNGHSVTAPSIQFLGNGSGKIVRTLPTETLNAAGGSISIGEGSHIDLIAGDTCAYLSVSGADVDETGTTRWSAASTSATSNVTDVVTVYSAPLTLGADMVLSQYIQVGGGNWNTTEHLGALIMNGHSVTAPSIQFLGNGSGKIVRTLPTETLNAAGGSISIGEGSRVDLIAGDTCAYLSVSGADVDETGTLRWSAASTAATSNVTNGVTVDSVPLTLGADMVLSENIRVGGSNSGQPGTLVMNGHSVTVPSFDFGGNGAGTSDGTGKVFVQNLQAYEGSTGKVNGGTISNQLRIHDNGNSLEVIQASGQTDGLSIDRAATDALYIGSSSVLTLTFDGAASTGTDYAFRWLGDHVTALQGYNTAGKLTWSGAPSGDTVTIWLDPDGYTYVGYVGAVVVAPHMGDANHDQKVDLQDFSLLKAYYGQTGQPWEHGNFNNDAQGLVNLEDFSLLKAHYNHTGDASTTPLTTVPEPATISLLLLGVVGLVRRRRK